MKTYHLVAAVAFVCVTLTSLAAKPESTGPDPDAILRQLYKAHDAQKGPFYDRNNRQLAEQYFSNELAQLIVKDATVSEGEVGAYEFDPLYASQDPGIKNFKIGAVQRGGNEKEPSARVAVTFKDNGKPREIRFDFQQQADKSWRISDIHYPDGPSLLEILRKVYPG